jgi:pimeloyl-ACP methyl ester carboxylesterase
VHSLPHTKIGRGAKSLLVFHGIGQTGLHCFEHFAQNNVDHYTTFAFDLPFHGANADFAFETISKSLLTELVADFLEKESINRFDVAGFSIGGRFALAVLEAFPDRIDRIYLIAPDGVTEHPLYSLATRYTLPRNVFKWVMQHPAPFFGTISVLQTLGLLNKSIVRFTKNILGTSEKRESLYKSWVAFSALRFDIKALHNTALKKNITILLFTGKYDKLVTSKTVAPLAGLLPENQHITLKSGHAQLVDQTGIWISAYLTKLSDT